MRSIKPRGMKKVGRLAERQRQVLYLLAEGKRMKDVGTILNICLSTVAFHKYRIMEVLHAENDGDLVKFAVRNHIIAP